MWTFRAAGATTFTRLDRTGTIVRTIELIVGLVLLPLALWSFWYPRTDFELDEKIGFLGIRNREQLELNRFGLLRHRIGATIFVLSAVVLIIDSIYLLT